MGRIESNIDPIHDGRFERGPISVDAADGDFEINMPLEVGATLHGIELYLMTVDANGAIDYDWAGFRPNIWALDEAPEHEFELVVHQTTGSSLSVSLHLPESTNSKVRSAGLYRPRGMLGHSLQY